MQDDEIALFNACTDLVSLRKAEAFPIHLFGSKRPGEWVPVREFCAKIGVAVSDLSRELFATWLSDPMANDAYAVVMFYDDESKWSMAAHYNRGRLPSNQAAQVVAVPASSIPDIPSAKL